MPAALHTERLLLRPFEPGDIEDSLAYRNDEEFARLLPHIPQPFSHEDAERFVATNMAEPWDRYPTFAVVFGGRVIGTVNLEVEPGDRAAMLGYAIARAHWGLGIAPEAAREVVDWGFRQFNLERVWASTGLRHARSQRVMEKLGMQREGIRAGHEGRDGMQVDEVVYGVSWSEWGSLIERVGLSDRATVSSARPSSGNPVRHRVESRTELAPRHPVDDMLFRRTGRPRPPHALLLCWLRDEEAAWTGDTSSTAGVRCEARWPSPARRTPPSTPSLPRS
ncbi:MAG: GNAT family N-acetyltransferase [Dehalococcoidia bacterium]|nr:GNAT family N-acetyltransferase [Dehalococcoidia bacterium]